MANDEGPLDARDSAALAAWLKTSPVHVEEFLGVSAIARDLKEARTDPEYSLEAILARARAEDDLGPTPLAARDRRRSGQTLTPLAPRGSGDGCVRRVESWLALDVER